MTVAPTGTNTDAGPHIYCGAMHSGFIATFRPGRTRSCILVLMGEVCVFCGSASDAPEHVYPRWFLKLWDQAGPFTAKLDGELLRTRSGAPLTSSKTWRVMLPCCKSCNGDLDRFFEKPAKRPLRTLLRDVQPLEDVADVRRAARWLVKTLALAAHPSVNHTAFPSRSAMDGNGSISSWGEYPRIVLDSFKIDEIPPDMSLWAAVTDPSNPGPAVSRGDFAPHLPSRRHGRFRTPKHNRVWAAGRSPRLVSTGLSPAPRSVASLRERRVGHQALAGSTGHLRHQQPTCP